MKYVIAGGTGHVGKAVARYLLDRQEKVTIITRDPQKAGTLLDHRAMEAQADIHDVSRLHAIFQQADRVFLLNPPAPPNVDTDVEERSTARALIAALKNTQVKKIVLESTSLAQKGTYIGDLGVLFELEELTRGLNIPLTVLRPAYYMTNWLSALQIGENGVKLTSFYPADLPISMIDPADAGLLAGEYLMASASPAITEIEGPRRYTSQEVAAAFSSRLGKPVALEVIPPDKWESAYRSIGFSPEAAKSYSGMNRIALEGKFDMPPGTIKTSTTLEAFLAKQSFHNG